MFFGFFFEDYFVDWGIEIARRNECKTVSCLTKKWRIYE